MGRRGLTFKTFMYTLGLITLVTAVSLGALCFILPGYYLREKQKTLERNADELEKRLNEAYTTEECADIIADFAMNNNSSVVAFDNKDELIAELSSPFLAISNREIMPPNIYISSVEKNGSMISSSEIKVIARKNPNDENEEIQPKNEEIQLEMGRTQASPQRVGIRTFYFQRETSVAVATKKLQNGLIDNIYISSTLQPINEATSVFISLTPYLIVFDFIIALAAAYLFASRLTKPILKISDAATMMRELKPGVLSDVRTGDELERLSQNLDSLYLSLCNNIDELKSEMEKTTQLEQSKTDFMRAAGHELKTPIAALNGMLEGMIDNVGVYKNHGKYLNESKGQVLKLARLVNEILTASKAENLEQADVFEVSSINGLVDEAVEMYTVLFKDKHLRLEKDIFDFTYETDSRMLLTALSNIISNAVNYTDSDGLIRISFGDSDAVHGDKVLSVENQCDNIDESLLPKLFEPFFTLNYSRDKTVSGTGLGLYIIRKNLDALGLSIKISNTEMGIKVSVYFPETC